MLCKQELWRMETRQAYTCGICQHLSPQELGVTSTQSSLIQSKLNTTSLALIT